MDFFDLIKTRRSIRQYTDQKVAKADIDKILTAGLMSPASKRSNPWEFIVIQDTNTLQKLSQCRPYGAKLLSNTALAIAIVADKSKSDVWVEDTSIAAIIMQLQAHELGLGSCWVQIRNRMYDEETSSETYLKEELNIPSDYGVLCLLSIGHKKEERQPHNEEKLAYDKLHTEKFEHNENTK